MFISIIKKISILFALTIIATFSLVNSSNATPAGCTFTANPESCSGTVTATGEACGVNAAGTACEAAGVGATSNADNNPFARTLCNVLGMATGNGGKAFAAFAIISLGIGFFTGKVSWGLMLGVAAGIAAMFGAPTIVAAIAGGDTFDCSTVSAS